MHHARVKMGGDAWMKQLIKDSKTNWWFQFVFILHFYMFGQQFTLQDYPLLN